MTPNLFAFLPLMACAAAVALAVLSARHAPALVGMSVGVAGWNGVVALASCLPDPGPVLWMARLAFVFTQLIGASMLIFLSGVARFRHRRLWIGGSLGAALSSAILIFLDPLVLESVRPVPWGGYYATGGPHVLAPLLVLGVLLVAPLPATVLAYHRSPPSRRRRQLAHVLVAYVVAEVATLDALGLSGYDVPPVGWASFIMAIGILYNAIAKVQLIDARTTLARTRFWLLFVAATLLPLYALWALAARWPGWASPLGRALALLGLWLYGVRVARWLLGRVYRGRRRQGELVRDFAETTHSAGTVEDVVAPLGTALGLGTGLELRAVALCVDVGEGPPPRYQVFISPAMAPAAPEEPLPAAPLARAELDPDAPGDDRARRWLEAYDAQVLSPLRHRGELVGVILASAPDRDLVLDADSRTFLERLSARAAVAFTNAALHDRLDRHSQNLEREVGERTRSLELAVTDLRAAQARLVHAERQSALGLLVAGVSHEVNNALNFIYANAPELASYVDTYRELYERAALHDAEAAAAAGRLIARAETVTAAVLRARSLIEDLRRFARPEETVPRAVDLREGLRATLQLLVPVLGARVAVRQRVAAGTYIVKGYSAALHHTLLALLLNAAQAIEGEGTIDVDLAPLGSDGLGGVRLTITDSGAGIDAAVLPRVFDPFFTTREGSSGLGLTASLQTAHRHGGTLTLEPVAGGRGTTACLTLPAVAPVQAVA